MLVRICVGIWDRHIDVQTGILRWMFPPSQNNALRVTRPSSANVSKLDKPNCRMEDAKQSPTTPVQPRESPNHQISTTMWDIQGTRKSGGGSAAR